MNGRPEHLKIVASQAGVIQHATYLEIVSESPTTHKCRFGLVIATISLTVSCISLFIRKRARNVPGSGSVLRPGGCAFGP